MEAAGRSSMREKEPKSDPGEVAALREELLRLRRELEALRLDGPWAMAELVDELLGMELVHEYNTRSA